MKKFKYIIIVFVLFIIYIYVSNISLIPKKIIVLEDEVYNIKKFIGVSTIETVSTSSDDGNLKNVDVNLFGKKVKEISVETVENIEVVPVGKIIGMKLYTKGVLVVGMSQIENLNNELVSPFYNCDIKEGDTILKINENFIDSITELKEVVNKCDGKNVELTIKRKDAIFTSNIIPAKTEDGEYKLGLWVKDAATGVGTLTYYEKNSGYYAALGHGIVDGDTGNLIEIDNGELVTSDVISITKGETNNPGEIKGKIINQKTIGDVVKNSEFGIYGNLTNLTALNINTERSVKVALRNEIETGKASILCSLDGLTTKEYDIQIEKININNNYDNKSMLIKIVDDELIEKTGGIIRGLSGSPILQNGKFIGCVTNVLVSNPQIGYGVFADLMIKEMRK